MRAIYQISRDPKHQDPAADLVCVQVKGCRGCGPIALLRYSSSTTSSNFMLTMIARGVFFHSFLAHLLIIKSAQDVSVERETILRRNVSSDCSDRR
jgi:hypothetical protein